MWNSTVNGRYWAVTLGTPYPRYLLLLMGQTALLWMLARLLFFFILLLAGGISAALDPTFAPRLFLIAVTAVLVWWDRRRAHELLLHANLGANPGWFWSAALFTGCILDLTFETLVEVF